MLMKTTHNFSKEIAFKGNLRWGNSVQVGFVPFWKGVNSKRKDFASNALWSKFIPFRVDSFSEGVLLCRNANMKSKELSPLS